MQSFFWQIFGIATALKVLLLPAYYSTDFEVHRNWLAITHSLPLSQWYVDTTSKWTLDYPPFFAYFEWLLSQFAQFVDPHMLNVSNLNYASAATVYFQRGSVIVMDIVYAIGVNRCLRALRISKESHQHFTGEILLLLNVGLVFVDHIHFQYNGFLFGILLISISFLLEGKYLLSTFTFALLLNFKHIFLYMAPAFGVYLLRFYCLDQKNLKGRGENFIRAVLKLLTVGLAPFVLSFAPFWHQLPQVLLRLFPFKRGLTHAYWAPNFWAIYNTADKVAAYVLRENKGPTTSSGLVQEFEHVVLPSVSPTTTFILTAVFMLPIVVKLLLFTTKSECKVTFLRAVVLCACSSFMFGWHVHEKAILMCLIPLCLVALVDRTDAKYAFVLSIAGYYSLFPLLFHMDLLVVRYSLYLAYIAAMYSQLFRIYKAPPNMCWPVILYNFGFIGLVLYEHLLSPLLGLSEKLPFMPLLLTSLYASVGVMYFFISYYLHTLDIDISHIFCIVKPQQKQTVKSTLPSQRTKAKTKQKLK